MYYITRQQLSVIGSTAVQYDCVKFPLQKVNDNIYRDLTTRFKNLQIYPSCRLCGDDKSFPSGRISPHCLQRGARSSIIYSISENYRNTRVEKQYSAARSRRFRSRSFVVGTCRLRNLSYISGVG